MSNFPVCLKFVLAYEGGFVNDPRDPGGATNKGVTLGTYRAWEGEPSLDVDDIRAIDDETVAAIYQDQYWNRVAGDKLPAGVDLMVFDFGVNAGPGRSVRMLQASVGAKADGWIGPATLGLVARMDRERLLVVLASARRVYYRSLSTFGVFGKGWISRVDACLKTATGMK